jgi:site-specific DNA-methyltransferase (adenine-specific)
MEAQLLQGDCRDLMPALPAGSVRLAYVDPPFFTQREHRLSPRDNSREYAFSDVWAGQEHYAGFLSDCLLGVRRLLADDGSLFFHCDRRAAHVARASLDRVFGASQFRSEIIWQYRRWSNARRGLLPAHQTLYLYTKGDDYVFNRMYVDYSPATNIDQILQRRVRDARGKAVYERDALGNVVCSGEKKGVPLSDVWDIPYLNPKAKERVGYPTQKPILLLERIIQLASAPGDLVFDPCCGSGTALVAARLLGRRALGIDRSEAAIALCARRLAQPVRTDSALLRNGRASYYQLEEDVLSELGNLDLVPVQRNRGIDAILREQHLGRPVAVRVQRAGESIEAAVEHLVRAGGAKDCALLLLIVTDPTAAWPLTQPLPSHVSVIQSPRVQVARALSEASRRARTRA